MRKEEEKARRELIKQEYLRRKQQQILEEQGLGKPKTKAKRPRPKSVHREESCSDSGTKCSSTREQPGPCRAGWERGVCPARWVFGGGRLPQQPLSLVSDS